MPKTQSIPFRIVSGGQTGVDRAALDAAMRLRIACGGWCPKGRRAEDGPLAGKYPLQETPSAGYEQRTEWNVRDSDGTLILAQGKLTGGTALTVEYAKRRKRPCLIVDLDRVHSPETVADWIGKHRIRVLNVAGSRERLRPGIYRKAGSFVAQLLEPFVGND